MTIVIDVQKNITVNLTIILNPPNPPDGLIAEDGVTFLIAEDNINFLVSE